MGGKAKNTDGAKLGKIGRTLGFIELGILIAEIALIIILVVGITLLLVLLLAFFPEVLQEVMPYINEYLGTLPY